MLAYLMASRLNTMPYALSISQCFVSTSSRAGRKHTTGNIMLIEMNLMVYASCTGMLEDYRRSLIHPHTWG
jgi:hypothetical protein